MITCTYTYSIGTEKVAVYTTGDYDSTETIGQTHIIKTFYKFD